MNNYIIISPARCGTSWVQDTIQRTLNYTGLPDLILENIDFPELILDATSPWIAKLFTDEYYKFSVPMEWWCKFATPIFMYRSNILDHFLSFIFATKTSIYNSTSEQIYPSIKITDKDFVFYKNIWDNFIKIKPYGIILKYETMQNDICQILPNEYDASNFIKLIEYDKKLNLLTSSIKDIKSNLKSITGLKNLENFIW